MAKYKPIDLVTSWSGKICEHSDFYLAARGKTGYSGRMCNPRNLSKKTLLGKRTESSATVQASNRSTQIAYHRTDSGV